MDENKVLLDVLSGYTPQEREVIERFLDEYGELTDNEYLVSIADTIESLN